MRTKAAKQRRLQRQDTQRRQAGAKDCCKKLKRLAGQWRTLEAAIISRTQGREWTPLTKEQVERLKRDMAHIYDDGIIFI